MIKTITMTKTVILCLMLWLLYPFAYACNASVNINLKNNCPWPVDFTYQKSGSSQADHYTLQPGDSHSVGKKTEITFTVTDTYGDKATVWLHSHYHFHWGFGNQCNYYYSPRDLGSIGYPISEHEWSGSTPTLDLTACQNGAQAQIKTIGLGKVSISKNGLYQKNDQTINITSGSDTYKINFTGTGTSCTFKLGQGIYCSHDNVGSIFTTGKLIFACQQVASGEGKCGWAGNTQSSSNNYGAVNLSSIS
ncbi:hypothetical protein L3V83_00960 [Thiotrichales bacterium 19X7-9]|nr:hypothetical protein [Thiotrichales bacterium 19X7-9]